MSEGGRGEGETEGEMAEMVGREGKIKNIGGEWG